MIIGATVCAFVVNGVRIGSSGIDEMYKDPEYADTWRYTGDDRYADDEQWSKDAPSGYKDHMGLREASFIQNAEQSSIPDYWSHDYSGNKHWGYAADPFYSKPDVWVDSSPKGYDDYVNMQSRSQNVYEMGAQFMPKVIEPEEIDLGYNLVE